MPIRRRERKMQGCRSPGSAQRFLAIHAAVANTFTTCRHLVTAKTHRLLRNEAFAAWQQAVWACSPEKTGGSADLRAILVNLTSPARARSAEAFAHEDIISRYLA